MTDADPRAELKVDRLPDLPDGREVWERLGHKAGNPFSTWEWASTWWRHFGDGREQHVLGLRAADRDLVAVLPLYVASRRPLRVLRLATGPPISSAPSACRSGEPRSSPRCPAFSPSSATGTSACLSASGPRAAGRTSPAA